MPFKVGSQLRPLLFCLITPLFCTVRDGINELHGTVNIIFANQNGIVAVTDSRLSDSKGVSVGEGQKLFQLDDRTVCTVAGFYFSPGTKIASQGSVGTALASQVINRAAKAPTFKVLSVSQKAEALAAALSLAFNVALGLNEASLEPKTPQPIQITVAGYQDGTKEIDQIVLLPGKDDRGTTLAPQPTSTKRTTHELIHVLAGILYFDDPILHHPDQFPAETLGLAGPAVRAYEESLKKDAGASMTVNEMKQLATGLEQLSSSLVPNLVGGTVESATIENDKVTSPPPALPPSEDIARKLPPGTSLGVAFDVNETVSHGPAIDGDAFGIIIVINGTFTSASLRLDNKAVIRSNFVDSNLLYQGSPIVLFGSSNTVKNCTLILGPNVRPDNDFVVAMRKNFPFLRLRKLATH